MALQYCVATLVYISSFLSTYNDGVESLVWQGI